MRLFTYLLFVTLACPALFFQAEAIARASEITGAIQKQYETINAFKASFSQTLTNAASGQSEVRVGVIEFMQPNFVRWDTKKPEPELLIVGDPVVWDYYPDEDLVLKFRYDQVFTSKTMLRFLSGKARLDEDFVVENQGDDNGEIKLRLIPREPEPGLVLAYMWVNPKTNMLSQVLVVDFYGNGNQVRLSDVEIDPEMDKSLFDFTPPDGVEVEDNTIEKMLTPPQ